MDKIKIEVCNPKFRDELNISYIRLLDASKSHNISETMDTKMMDYALTDSMDFDVHLNDMRIIDDNIVYELNNEFNIEDEISLNYKNLFDYYIKFNMIKNPVVNLNKFFKIVTTNYNIFEVNILADRIIDEYVFLECDGDYYNIRKDLFIILTGVFIECAKNPYVKYYELVVSNDDRNIVLRFKLTKKKYFTKGLVNFSLYPTLYIGGRKG